MQFKPRSKALIETGGVMEILHSLQLAVMYAFAQVRSELISFTNLQDCRTKVLVKEIGQAS